MSKFEVVDWKNRTPEHKYWWDQYVRDLDTEILEDICHQVLDLYSQPTTDTKLAPHSPPPGARPKPPFSFSVLSTQSRSVVGTIAVCCLLSYVSL